MPPPSGRPLVAVQLPPGPELLSALREALDGGPAVLPLPPALPVAERERLLAAMAPSALVTADGSTTLDDAPAVPDDVAVVIATSGSTGLPKGVELSAEALYASAGASLARLQSPAGARWLCCLPLHHVGGLQVLIRSLLLGSEPLVLPRFDVAAVAGAPQGLDIAVVPTMLRRLIDAGVDLARFRVILLGGAGAPPGLLARAREAGGHVVTTYGMTETGGGCVYDGVPLDGVRVRLVGGRITIAGPVVCRSYRLAPGGPVDGWLRTEDVGRWNADGRLEVLGRADDVIVTGGENVPAAQVAALVEEHPLVREAAVVGEPDEEWGERVVAVVVPRDPAAPPDLPALRDFVSARAPAAYAPRRLAVVDALPLLANGKLDRLALRDRIAHLLDE